ncbi:MAG: hypothetical protein ACREL5_09720 [Gemmatimonadales bacterium]
MIADLPASRAGRYLAAVLLVVTAARASPQGPIIRLTAPDSATVAAGPQFHAAGLERWLLGGTYRDLWIMPIRLPVLALHAPGGGFVTDSNGNPSGSLRLGATDGSSCLVHLIDWSSDTVPDLVKGTPVQRMMSGGATNRHPAGPIVARHRRRIGTWYELGASWFPAVWDAAHAFGDVDGRVAWSAVLPSWLHPTLTLRAGGKKLVGTFPFEEAAFIAGSSDRHRYDPQRYAGDASLTGAADLRVPLLRASLFGPLTFGLLGTVDYGRVYVGGESPGGWHRGFSAGFSVGFRGLTADFRVWRSGEVVRGNILTDRAGVSVGIPE